MGYFLLPAVSDVLLDATEVLGGEQTLKILFLKLVQVILAYAISLKEVNKLFIWTYFLSYKLFF